MLYGEMFLEKLVEQHRVHCVVADRVRFTFFVGQHQRRINLCDFFGNQPKLRCFFGVTLIMEGTGLSARIASLAFSIAAMSFLNRSEEATVPSCPVSDTTTGAVVPLCVVTPKMLPIQVVSSTFAPHTEANTDNVTGRGDAGTRVSA